MLTFKSKENTIQKRIKLMLNMLEHIKKNIFRGHLAHLF